jgi:hypothetical protein
MVELALELETHTREQEHGAQSPGEEVKGEGVIE